MHDDFAKYTANTGLVTINTAKAKILWGYCFFLGILFFCSCTPAPKKKINNTNPPKIVEIKGYKVPKDSINDPIITPVEPKIIPVGQPISIIVDSGFYRNGAKPFSYFKDKIGQNYDLVKYIGGDSSLYIPRSIIEDTKGNIWFASIGGVSFFDGKKIWYINTPSDSAYKVVNDIIEDSKGNIFYSTGNGRINKYDGSRIMYFKTDGQGLQKSFEDKKGRLWFCGFGGVLCYDGINITHWGEKHELTFKDVNCIIEDKNENIWFGTWKGGLNKYDGKNFTHFTVEEGFCSDKVMSIVEDKNGNIWVGTYGGGVSYYNGKTFTTFTSKQGLANDTVSSICQDKKGNIWFGTQNGLSEMNSENVRLLEQNKYSDSLQEPWFRNFSMKDGFKGGEFLYNSVCEDRNGNIWWGTSNGLLIYHPDRDFGNIPVTNIHQLNWWKEWWFWSGLGMLLLVFGTMRHWMSSKRSK